LALRRSRSAAGNRSIPGPIVLTTGATATAVHGSNNSLYFYWATNGTSTWHKELVAGAGSTFSAPSLGLNSQGTAIATAGPNNSLDFYRATSNASTWRPEVVAGAGSTF
jgi:hypothetical protein